MKKLLDPNSIAFRIIQYQKYKGLTDSEFSAKLTYSASTEISRIRNGHEVPRSFISRMVEFFPVNKNWLMTGEGPMEKLNDNFIAAEPMELYDNGNEILKSELKLKNELINSLQNHIKDLQSSNAILKKILSDLTTNRESPFQWIFQNN